MNVNEARAITHDVLKEHGLYQQGWRFKLGHGKNRLGVCNHRQRIIGLSKYLIQLGSDEEIRNTILHEVAHALTPGHKHDHVWRAKAREIGHPNPTRLSNVSYDVPHRIEIHCETHGVVAKRQRRMRVDVLARTFCAKCGRLSKGQLTQVLLTS